MPEVSAEASEETLSVIDDHDPDPVLTMDNSQVDVSSEGVYPVTYIAQEPVASYVHYDILEVDEFWYNELKSETSGGAYVRL